MKYKEIKTLGDLEAAFNAIPEEKKQAWADAFWTLYSQDTKIIAKVNEEIDNSFNNIEV